MKSKKLRTQKYVYLFELDSVRKTDEEIIIGQKALYNEIVKNGNVVVLTFNQLVDSRAFFSLLDNKEYKQSLYQLFKEGAIKISQYGEYRTIVHYLLNTLDPDNKFYFSAIPLKNSQRRLIALIRRSLIYSDLNEINEFIIQKNKTINDIKELFVEVDENNEISCSKLSVGEMKEILENLYYFLEIIFELNSIPKIYLNPRNVEELNGIKFIDILNIIGEWSNEADALWNPSLSIISQLICFGKNDRSAYHKELRELSERNTFNIEYCQYAEAIIDLCYNYACELSICNISKHYSVRELKVRDGNYPTFKADFYNRLQQTWNNGNNSTQRYLLPETNRFEEFESKELPMFSDAVRVVNYNKEFFKEIKTDDKIWNYESNLDDQQKIFKKSIIKRTFFEIASVFIGTIIVFLIELIIQAIQNIVDGELSFTKSIYTALLFAGKTIAFLIIAEFVSVIIQKGISKLTNSKSKNISSLGEAIVNLKEIVASSKRILLNKYDSYKNDKVNNSLYENYNNGKIIDFVTTKEMKKYIKFKKKCDKEEYFGKLSAYPIADIEDKKIKKELLKLEEIYQINFGIPYESKYNTLVVDPIENGESYFSYERILPTGGEGVVVVTKNDDKFVLLQQARHAIRSVQISFPRGFNEDNIRPVENAIKEISEEINPSYIGTPIFLGNVSADSGLVGSKVYVYYVEVKCDNMFEETEGISNIVYKTEEELEDMIRKNELKDGFTLSAYMLYKCKKETKHMEVISENEE